MMIADTRGNVAIEFALCMPFLILMAIGMSDYGMAALTRSTLDAAARSGLQVMVAHPDDTSQARDAALAVAPDATAAASSACFCSDGSTVACTGACALGVPQKIATVTVTKSYALLFPWPGFTSPLTLTATAKGRVQ